MCGPGLTCLQMAGEEAATCKPMDTPCVRSQQVSQQIYICLVFILTSRIMTRLWRLGSSAWTC